VKAIETRVVQLEKTLGVKDDIGDMTDEQIDAELSAFFGRDVTGMSSSEIYALFSALDDRPQDPDRLTGSATVGEYISQCRGWGR